jgi:uncharacterized protein YwqG
MTGAHDRRSFLRELLRGATRTVGELGGLRDAAAEAGDEARGTDPPGVPEWSSSPVPAPPAEPFATTADLRRLCGELGREAWGDEAVAVARTSTRLTRSDAGRSWLGGAPALPVAFDWPSWDGKELTFMAQIELGDVVDRPFPGDGSLLFFYALDRAPSGLRPRDKDACRVVHVPVGSELAEAEGARPKILVAPSAELTLPVEPTFELDGWELEKWTDLRERLAVFQGVELEDRSADYHALHRMLGYPETFADGMELDAQLVSHGVDLEEEPYAHPHYENLAPGAADWRLLLQLSSDDDAAISLGYFERLFIWIRDEDLRNGRFDRVRAFVR